MSALKAAELKRQFSAHLRDPDLLKRPEGIPTGMIELDEYLLWKGLPKGGASLLCGELGTGPSSLCLGAIAESLKQGRWAAWIDGDTPLSPVSICQKGLSPELGLKGLEKLVVISRPDDGTKLFWVLQELMSSALFEVIGCDLGRVPLKEHQLRKLQVQARDAHIALVLLSQNPPLRGSAASVFSLIAHFKKRELIIERALHRPTPHRFPRSLSYARFTLHTQARIDVRIDFDVHPPLEVSNTTVVQGLINGGSSGD